MTNGACSAQGLWSTEEILSWGSPCRWSGQQRLAACLGGFGAVMWRVHLMWHSSLPLDLCSDSLGSIASYFLCILSPPPSHSSPPPSGFCSACKTSSLCDVTNHLTWRPSPSPALAYDHTYVSSCRWEQAAGVQLHCMKPSHHLHRRRRLESSLIWAQTSRRCR